MTSGVVRLMFLGALAIHLQAGDWRQFRGPPGGVATDTNLPVILDARKSIAWKADLPGRGLSSAIVVGERVFVTCSSGARQDRLHVICFNAGDGSKRWERQFWATGRTTCHETISVAAPTPVSDGERIFALFSSNDLVCLDLEGNLLWLRGLTRDYPNASNSLGMSSSPVVADGVLIAQVESDSDAFTAGLEVRSGTNLWKLDRPRGANWTSPLVMRDTAGKSVVTLQSGKGIAAVEPVSGRTRWSFDEGAATIPSSAERDGILFVPSQGLAAIEPGTDERPAQLLWRSNQLRPSTPSPVVVGDRVLVLNDAGVLSCGAAATGTRLWQLRLKGPFTSTPVAAGPLVYCVNEKGLIQVVNAEGEEGGVVSELDLGEVILSTPSIANGALYFRSDGRLWKLTKFLN